MHCQLDQVKQILDIASAVRNSLLRKYHVKPYPPGLSLEAGSAICGLLILFDHDAFMQKGIINTGVNSHEHYWVDVYMDGEPFILDATLTRLENELGQKIPDVVFMPEDDAVEMYGYARGQDIEWQPDHCGPGVWEEVLMLLGINKPVELILQEISNK